MAVAKFKSSIELSVLSGQEGLFEFRSADILSAGRRHPCRGHLDYGEIITLHTAASAVRHAIFGEKFRKVQGDIASARRSKSLFDIGHLRSAICSFED